MLKQGDRVRARKAGEYSPIMRVAAVRWLPSTPHEADVTCEWVHPGGQRDVWVCHPNDLEVIEHAGPPDGIYQLDDVVYAVRACNGRHFRISQITTYTDPFHQGLVCQDQVTGDYRRLDADEVAFVSRSWPTKAARKPQAGDSVKLRSGGPELTVLVPGAMCRCAYFAGDKYRMVDVPELALEQA